MSFAKKQLARLFYALHGILHAIRHDRSFKLQFWGGGIFLVLFYYFTRPLSEVETFFLVLAFFMVLITELQNSAYEEALDRLHPDIDESIGRSKDMAAGAVLLAGLFFLIVVLYIIFT